MDNIIIYLKYANDHFSHVIEIKWDYESRCLELIYAFLVYWINISGNIEELKFLLTKADIYTLRK